MCGSRDAVVVAVVSLRCASKQRPANELLSSPDKVQGRLGCPCGALTREMIVRSHLATLLLCLPESARARCTRASPQMRNAFFCHCESVCEDVCARLTCAQKRPAGASQDHYPCPHPFFSATTIILESSQLATHTLIEIATEHTLVIQARDAIRTRAICICM